MPVFVTMPALSPTMKKGNLVKWLKKEGDEIEVGDVIAEIDTDKAAMDVESMYKGILYKIFVQEGTHDVTVKSKIAAIKQKGDTTEDMEKFIEAVTSAVLDIIVTPEILKPEPMKKQQSNDTILSKSTAMSGNNDKKTYASPLAKRIATEYGIDIENIGLGTGPHGRIVKADVLERVSSPIQVQQSTVYYEGDYHDEKVGGVKLAVASVLTECKQTVPHFYMQITANVSEMQKILSYLKKSSTLDNNIKITANEFVIKATALALRDFPNINASWNDADKSIRYYHNVDVAFAVSTSDGGLYTPVIREVDRKSLKEIALDVRNLAEKANNSALKTDEITGGGITTSNLGIIEVESFLSIINPPQASILSIPRIVKKPIVDENDNIVIGHTLTLGYAIDHRVIGGKEAGLFLARIRDILENPIILFM